MTSAIQYQYLESHLGEKRTKLVLRYLKELNCSLKLVPKRKSKLGDFRVNRKVRSISVNMQSNTYRFILTLMHELAHLKTYHEFSFKVKPHGPEWKNNFRQILKLFEVQALFHSSEELMLLFASEYHKPRACAGVHLEREKVLRKYDEDAHLPLLEELKPEQEFIFRGRRYKKIKNRRTRVLCLRVDSNRQFTIPKGAQVQTIQPV